MKVLFIENRQIQYIHIFSLHCLRQWYLWITLVVKSVYIYRNSAYMYLFLREYQLTENEWIFYPYILFPFLKGSSQMVDSGIYIWSTKLRRFKLFQNIMTTGAYDWTYFSVNGYHFLAAAQAFDGFSTLTDSRIYVLQDKQFVLFQTMEVTNFIISLYPLLEKKVGKILL